MLLRLSTIVIAVILLAGTPGWYFSDYLFIADLLMIFFSLVSIIIFKLSSSKTTNPPGLLLSLNTMIYIVATAQSVYGDSNSNRIVYRLELVFNTHFHLPAHFGRGLELFNFIQVLAGALVALVLLFLFCRNQLRARHRLTSGKNEETSGKNQE